MLLLLTDSLLLLFLTLTIGDIARKGLEKVFRLGIRVEPLGIFLLGLMLSSCYFNMVSFWWPVNYLSLVPLGVISLAWLSRHKNRETSTLGSFRRSIRYFTGPGHRLAAMGVLSVVALYAVLPPSHQDSPGYHYLSVLWYEKYKVVPGLVNIHGRFAFNPVSFIIGAAWSFTGLAGRSVYPLNIVLAGLFYFWLLKRVFINIRSTVALLYLGLLLFFFRHLLINISGPMSDLLVDICILYSLISLFEGILFREITLSTMIVPVLVMLYSITAKLSSFPVFLALPFLYYLLPKKGKGPALLLRILTLSLFLYIPWLIRNYIMSGYLVFPFPYLDFFHPDWKAPVSVLNRELFLIHTYQIQHISAPLWHSSIPLVQRLENWFSLFITNRTFVDPVFVILALFSPLYWLIPWFRTKKIDQQIFLFWFIVYTSAWIGVLTSMVFRFAVCTILLSILTPLFVWMYSLPSRKTEVNKWIVNGALVLFSLHYLAGGYTKLKENSHPVARYWLLPLKDKQYREGGIEPDFPFRVLRPGVKLYIADSCHNCINAGLPCMVYPYGEIEMRGPRIDQGFRMIRDTIMFPPHFRPL